MKTGGASEVAANTKREMVDYITTILRRCPIGSRCLELGLGGAKTSSLLAHRGVTAEGINPSPRVVEMVHHQNSLLGGSSIFKIGDPLCLLSPPVKPDDLPHRYSVIHHQGFLQHWRIPVMHSALAQQVIL